jgi:hypothetical protein
VNENDAPSALPARRRRQKSLVTSLILRGYEDGTIDIHGFAASPALLAGMARLISGGAIAALPSGDPRGTLPLEEQAGKTAPPIAEGIESEKENLETTPIAPAVEIQPAPPLEDQVGKTAPLIAARIESEKESAETGPTADPGDFLTARVQRVLHGWVPAPTMWTAYLGWARERQLPALGRTAFGQALKIAGLRTSRSRRGANGKQMRTWEGCRLLADRAAQLVMPESSKDSAHVS